MTKCITWDHVIKWCNLTFSNNNMFTCACSLLSLDTPPVAMAAVCRCASSSAVLLARILSDSASWLVSLVTWDCNSWECNLATVHHYKQCSHMIAYSRLLWNAYWCHNFPKWPFTLTFIATLSASHREYFHNWSSIHDNCENISLQKAHYNCMALL